MTLSERFFDHVGKFRKTATELVQAIIEEIQKNKNKRTYIPG